ncbi:hypothetical protein HZA42_00530 [Candidatus Peregrinibacteria bacterium]|nr:hypothetical protein [Candidatus Peregrinibacteria bacterium]
MEKTNFQNGEVSQGQSKNVSKFVVSFGLVLLFSFVFGPAIFAQFTRSTGDVGYGYGYGYGYGSGYGTNDGSYRTDNGAANEYLYGYGYAYFMTVPTGLTATAISSSRIDLTWTAVTGATSYKVYRSDDSYVTAIATGVTGTSYSNTSGLTAGTRYSYKITANDSNGESGKTGTVSARTFSAVTAETPAVTITAADTTTITTTVAQGVSASLNLAALKVAGDTNTTVTMPAAVNANVTTALGTVAVVIPTSTVVTASTSWDGVIDLPIIVAASTVTAPAITGQTVTVQSVITVGDPVLTLTFDTPVSLTIPGQSSGRAAFYTTNAGVSTVIAACTGGGNTLGAGQNECYYISGTDMIIWTKHFTAFGSYTQTAAVATPSDIWLGNGGGQGGQVVKPSVPTPAAKVTKAPGDKNDKKAAGPKVGISMKKLGSYRPGARLNFTYTYGNAGTKALKVNVVRQLLNSKGASVKSTTTPKTIKPKSLLSVQVRDILPKTLKAGEYTVKVKVTEGKKTEENSFKITVGKK